MSELMRAALLLGLLCGAAPLLRAQSTAQPTGSITGRVAIEGKAASGVQVVLLPSAGGEAVGKTSTDADGLFRFSNVAPARYTLTPLAPAYIAESPSGSERGGRFVVVTAGDTLGGIDFSLVRGGVITGTVDAGGQPVIGERVNLLRVDEKSGRFVPFTPNASSFETDDRGIYRIFGLPPGRYKVSVGQGAQSGMIGARGRRPLYLRTFSPNVTDETHATIVEVAAGGETTGVDVKIGQPLETFTARGRIVDEQTGQPLPDVPFSYAAMRPDGRSAGGIGRGLRSDAKGEFQIESLRPGRYVALISSEGEHDFYSESVPFEINGGDVSSIELKRRRGISVSGAVVIEGRNDPSLLARLSQVPIGSFLFQPELNSPGMLLSKIAPDGSFRIGGLRPGKLRTVPNGQRMPRGFMLLRLERDGSPSGDAIDLAAGEQLTGVRVVLAYGNGAVRGRVNVTGGALPAGTGLRILLRRVGSNGATSSQLSQVDARGLFLFEDLAPGDYELILGGTPTVTAGVVAPSRIPVVRRAINVTDNTTTDVTLILNLTPNGAGAAQ